MTRYAGPGLFGMLFTVAILTGCGGGGSGGGGPVLPTPTPSGIIGGVTPTPTPTPHIVEYPILTANVGPSQIVSGPDGALWFTEASGSAIGRISTSGAIKEYPVANSGGQYSITVGPDNALWFTDNNGFIGRMDTAGNVTMKVQITSSPQSLGGIATGSDGNLWYTGINSVGKMTLAGSFTSYPLPTQGGIPTYLTGGSDGALWVTEPNSGKISRVPTSGNAIVEYALPTTSTSSSGAVKPVPLGIVSGPDGNLWVTDSATPAIDRVTPSGSILVYPVPGSFTSNPQEITSAADGNLYYTEASGFGDRIGRMAISGAVTGEFGIPHGGGPEGIASGSDGNIWFAETNGDRIGELILH